MTRSSTRKKTSAKVAPAKNLTHVDARGHARMVDVGGKQVTRREALARGIVRMQPATLKKILKGKIEKGEVLTVARIAGITGAKLTSNLIPMCHPLPIEVASVEIAPLGHDRLCIKSRVRISARTGVEMEALSAVSAAALTIYDMCKAVDRGMVIEEIRLIEKSGGRSGTYRAASYDD